jgi:L-methionine (R)-S-oxide reductase
MTSFHQQLEAALGAPESRRNKARRVATLIRDHTGFHWVGLYDVSATHISAIAWTGPTAPAFPSFPIMSGINGAAVASRQPVVVQDVSHDCRYLRTFGATKAEAIFPVLSGDDQAVLGTLDIESDRINAFSQAHIHFFATCATLLRPLWLLSEPR